MTATPAAELRQAAQRLRELAAAASSSPWEADHSIPYGHRVGPADGSDWVAWCGEHGEDTAAEHADYIAALHPGVAIALADWLEQAAKAADAAVIAARNVWGSDEPEARDQWIAEMADQHALAVARQILGTPAAVLNHQEQL